MYRVCMIASRRRHALYRRDERSPGRIWQHKTKAFAGFSAKYGVDRLVWYEGHENIGEEIAREKALKIWRRDWKPRLIEEMNPDWQDLYTSRSGRRLWVPGSFLGTAPE